MRKLVFISLCLLLTVQVSRADEGMWLLSMLKGKNIEQMKSKGFKLSADDVYSVNKNSLKDAIVGLGSQGRPFRHFCSGEIISSKGLFLTNHHCGYGQIQKHSSVEHNYLKDGFWAYSMDQELANPGITASILVRMEDVTEQFTSKLSSKLSEEKREAKIRKIAKKIEAKAEKGTHYKANVKSMFNGNQFFLFVYVIYKDVRLVGAPPSAMGKFGGDTDNWMWPRHTADFSLFRIYTAPDGSPAEYSKDNVPLKPKHHLPISIKGVKEGDFAMVMGFPGTTNRFLSAAGLKKTMDITNKLRYEIRTVKLNEMREQMNKDEAIRIKYASKYAGSSNYWKYSYVQNKALRQLNTMGNKEQIEADLTKWVNADPKRVKEYGETLKLIKDYYETNREVNTNMSYVSEALLSGAEVPVKSLSAKKLLELLSAKKVKKDKVEAMAKRLKAAGDKFYKDYDLTTDKNMMSALFKLYSENNSEKPSIFKVIDTEYNGDIDMFVNALYRTSVFADQTRFDNFIKNPTKEVIENDLAYKTGESIYSFYLQIANKYVNVDKIEKGMRLYTKALLEMNKDKAMYPDANSTIRLTYGDINGYSPKDAVYYNYFTTLDGVIEKDDPNNHDFQVPERLKELHAKKDYGQYAKNGVLNTCFISNNDITGGNSGSPVINANGELIGTAFDGNSEAMSGDIDFEENLQRCINLDVRYTLFIIEKYAGAKNLIEEMTIVK
ncbi:MAG: S46 family peptidase [Bacteroidales bacterium]|jgi:hypothetical protein|nr:S46 family peptidase [Bacteroidales bacterium]